MLCKLVYEGCPQCGPKDVGQQRLHRVAQPVARDWLYIYVHDMLYILCSMLDVEDGVCLAACSPLA